MPFSSYLHEKIAGWINGDAMPTPPTTLYVGLSIGDPLEDGSELNEPVGSGYARKEVTFTAAPAVGGGTKLTSNIDVVFGPVVDSSWGTLTHGVLFDQLGNILDFGPLGVQRTPPVGDTVSFGSGAIQFKIK